MLGTKWISDTSNEACQVIENVPFDLFLLTAPLFPSNSN